MTFKFALGTLLTGLVMAGCAAPAAQESQPEAAATPTVPASATGTPNSAAPTPSPAFSGASPSASPPSARADIAEVVTTDLVMRSAPGTGPDSEIYAPTLSAPTLLYLLEGPTAADGYEWYRVFPFDEYFTDIGRPGPAIAWVAAGGKDGEAWITPWTGPCPASAIEEILERSPFVALACFGNRDHTLEGTVRDCPDPGSSAESWYEKWCLMVPFGYQAQLPPGFVFYSASAGPFPGQGQAIRVTGHYDDAAAAICSQERGAFVDLTPPEVIFLHCRASFVATEITPTSAP